MKGPLIQRASTFAVLPAGSSLGTIDLRCAGGARSGNPDADIDIWIYIWVEGSGTVASATARGYSPSAVASRTIETVPYDRRIECSIYAGFASAFATGTILADCGDERRT